VSNSQPDPIIGIEEEEEEEEEEEDKPKENGKNDEAIDYELTETENSPTTSNFETIEQTNIFDADAEPPVEEL
jgi:hypothetical protein